MKDCDLKRNEAFARQVYSDKLTPAQRLKSLDDTFGVGIGAKRERAKLALKPVKK